MKKDKEVTEKPTKTTEQTTPKEQKKQEVAPPNTPADEDDILYYDTDDDSNTSLPDPFTPINPKKQKHWTPKKTRLKTQPHKHQRSWTPQTFWNSSLMRKKINQPKSSPSKNRQARDHVTNSTFSEKGDQRMSRSQCFYVTICSSLHLIIVLHLCICFFTFFVCSIMIREVMCIGSYYCI